MTQYIDGPSKAQARYNESIKAMNSFLRPPQGSMPDYAYRAELTRRQLMWNNFVKNNKR